MAKALIIDDEKHCSDNLQWLLAKYCPELEVAATVDRAEKAIPMIRQLKPLLVFLDVEMPGMTGFEMLESLQEIDFDIIFTTAYDQYAIRAIRFGAMDYLVKPIDKDELRHAVDIFLKGGVRRDTSKQLSALLTHIRRSNDLTFQKIALPAQVGFELVLIKNIMVCEGSSNYTNVHLDGGQHMLVSRTLKEIEQMLDHSPFFRVHHSFLVNLQFIV